MDAQVGSRLKAISNCLICIIVLHSVAYCMCCRKYCCESVTGAYTVNLHQSLVSTVRQEDAHCRSDTFPLKRHLCSSTVSFKNPCIAHLPLPFVCKKKKLQKHAFITDVLPVVMTTYPRNEIVADQRIKCQLNNYTDNKALQACLPCKKE